VPYGDAEALAAVFARHPGDCCFFVEPVQGEGGVRIPPRGYVREVETLCREHGQLLVLDEIQTGLGRLGRWWGADFEGVQPDVLLSGKTLGGGVLPVSAVIATPEVYGPISRDPQLHSSTFANAPIMAAAARATIGVLGESDLIGRSASVGRTLTRELRALAAEHGEVVREVRGAGLLIGLELASAGLAGELVLELVAEHRVLPSYSLNADATVRLTPSALISEDQQRWLLDAVAAAVQVVHERAG
jgi:putrescine aminotransferase